MVWLTNGGRNDMPIVRVARHSLLPYAPPPFNTYLRHDTFRAHRLAWQNPKSLLYTPPVTRRRLGTFKFFDRTQTMTNPCHNQPSCPPGTSNTKITAKACRLRPSRPNVMHSCVSKGKGMTDGLTRRRVGAPFSHLLRTPHSTHLPTPG